MPVEWIAFAVTGAVAGFLAGLLGIGGGLIIVPALAFMMAGQAPHHAMHMAVATSLASILATGASSVIAHHRRGAVQWRSVGLLAPGLLAGSLIAAWIAAQLSSPALRWLFVAFCLYMAWRLLRPQRKLRAAPRAIGGAELGGVGIFIGLVSALVGIGGGSLVVPYLHWRGRSIHISVATSAACGLPIAAAGTLGYVHSGWSLDLPAPHLGFVYLPALLGIAAASVVFAPLGAAAAHRLPTEHLKRVFGLFLAIVAVLLILGL